MKEPLSQTHNIINKEKEILIIGVFKSSVCFFSFLQNSYFGIFILFFIYIFSRNWIYMHRLLNVQTYMYAYHQHVELPCTVFLNVDDGHFCCLLHIESKWYFGFSSGSGQRVSRSSGYRILDDESNSGDAMYCTGRITTTSTLLQNYNLFRFASFMYIINAIVKKAEIKWIKLFSPFRIFCLVRLVS